jgi:hypothetical protein
MRIATDSSSYSHFSAPSLFCPAVPSSAVQKIKGERCLQTTAGVLMTCTRADESGFWEVLHARSLGFFFNTRENHCE